MRFRKFTALDRDHPVFELIEEDGTVLLDISLNNKSVLEIAFSQGIPGKILSLDDFSRLIEEGRDLARASLPG